jgi:ABC-2 type transport system permease protein
MKAQLGSEMRKLLSIRSAYWIAIAAIVVNLVSVFSVAGQSAAEYAKPLEEQQFFFLGMFVRLFVVVLGIRIVTDEYRHGTIVPTFVFEPRRGRVLVAKGLVGAAAGLLTMALAQAALVGSAVVMFASNGHDLTLGDQAAEALVGSVMVGALWGAIGVAVGAVIRNQVIAIVGAFVWLMMLEEMVASRFDSIAPYLPGSAGFGLSLGGPNGFAVTAALTLTAYAVVGLGFGAMAMRARDVS